MMDEQQVREWAIQAGATAKVDGSGYSFSEGALRRLVESAIEMGRHQVQDSSADDRLCAERYRFLRGERFALVEDVAAGRLTVAGAEAMIDALIKGRS